MSLPRIRLEDCEQTTPEGGYVLSAYQVRHLIKALRCYEGSLVEGLGAGVRKILRIKADNGRFCALACEDLPDVTEQEHHKNPKKLVLLLALLKADQFDNALRFATELGVTQIRIVECERSVARIDASKYQDKLSRYKKIVRQSTLQCGSLTAPEILAPVRLADFSDADFASLPAARYAAVVSPDAVPVRECAVTDELAVAIGPEGDWTQGEVGCLIKQNFIPISLGQRILRASTAVAAVCAYLKNR